MKSKMFSLAGALLLAAVIGRFYAVPLMAQVRAALVQDRDSVARNHYQATLSCTNAQTTCFMDFAPVPPGKRLIIDHVSYFVQTPSLDAYDFAGFRNASLIHMVRLTRIHSTQGAFNYEGNEEVSIAFDTGEIPEAQVANSSGSIVFARAFISGYMIDVP